MTTIAAASFGGQLAIAADGTSVWAGNITAHRERAELGEGPDVGERAFYEERPLCVERFPCLCSSFAVVIGPQLWELDGAGGIS